MNPSDPASSPDPQDAPRPPYRDARYPARGPELPLPGRRFLPLGLFLVLAFLFGVMLDRAGWLGSAPGGEPVGVRKDFVPFWEAWDLVKEHYVDQKSVQPVKMTHFAIAGMLESLGDEGHTTFLAPEERAAHEERPGRPDGGHRRPHLDAQADSHHPADHAGFAGARRASSRAICSSKSTTRRSPGCRCNDRRGGARQGGDVVNLEIAREGAAGPIDIPITRGKVEVPDVSWHMPPGQAYAHRRSGLRQEDDDQLRRRARGRRTRGPRACCWTCAATPAA